MTPVRRIFLWLGVALSLPALLLGFVLLTVAGASSEVEVACTPAGAGATTGGDVSGGVAATIVTGSDAERQLGHARTFRAVGDALAMPAEGQRIAIAVGMVEAGMLNQASRAVPESLAYPHDKIAAGDHDSVGIMQQRAGWGTVAQRMDVAHAVGKFYTALAAVPSWQRLDAGDAAQRVQRSAFPSRYAEKMEEAGDLLAAAGGPASGGVVGASGAVAADCPTAPEGGADVLAIGGLTVSRVQVQGKWLDVDTANRITQALGTAYRLNQGSWSTSVAASGGTHAGSGVADLTPLGPGWLEAESALRGAGLIAWFRDWPGNLHIHLVNPHVDGLSLQARNQVAAWNRGEDGLGSTPGR